MRILPIFITTAMALACREPTGDGIDDNTDEVSHDTEDSDLHDTDDSDLNDTDVAIPDLDCPALDVTITPGAGLYDHHVTHAESDDGVHFQSVGTTLLDHASVPDAIALSNTRDRVYYINANPGQHGIFAAEREDGDLFEPISCVHIDGDFNGNAVDPDIVHLTDGSWKLFYYEGWFVTPPPQPEEPHPFYVATSDDGFDFQVEAKILSIDGGGTDPTGVQLADGSWLLAIAYPSNVRLFRSDDGTTFTEQTQVPFGDGIPELAVFPDGKVRLYNAEMGTMRVYSSDDDGQSWVVEGEAGVGGADPSLVHLADGRSRLYLKQFPPPDGGGPPPTP